MSMQKNTNDMLSIFDVLNIKTKLKRLNKPRLLLALYAEPKDSGSPHYALFVTPKFKGRSQNPQKEIEPIQGTKYHIKRGVKRTDGVITHPWCFEEVNVPDLDRDTGVLVCTVIGKVLSMQKLKEVIPDIHIYQSDDRIQFKARGFDSKMWCHDTFDELWKTNAVVAMDWRTAEGGTRAFLDQKHGKGQWTQAITKEYRNTPYVPIVDLMAGSIVRGHM
ncbi:hypothetical protein N7478_007116 [Penicillium angulare]|uniref:uncharacterized protein n=1 Tax=Penicillium angulare TaxID=116970 RepID=UPI0025401745|nr:uncharacterized protein N7478_007116 [Penicillium angulare]KAJ5281744.1 hypothetical protein N7478_007116 [Penicillium angulare]